jgi:hypothetical protein
MLDTNPGLLDHAINPLIEIGCDQILRLLSGSDPIQRSRSKELIMAMPAASIYTVPSSGINMQHFFNV